MYPTLHTSLYTLLVFVAVFFFSLLPYPTSTLPVIVAFFYSSIPYSFVLSLYSIHFIFILLYYKGKNFWTCFYISIFALSSSVFQKSILNFISTLYLILYILGLIFLFYLISFLLLFRTYYHVYNTW